MKILTKILAATAVVVGLGFAGTSTAEASHPQKVIVQAGYNPFPFPYPYPFPLPYPNPGPFPGPFPNPIPRVDIDYVVVYKTGVFGPQKVYGKFETLTGARSAALRLESFGYPVRIVPVRDYNNNWRW